MDRRLVNEIRACLPQDRTKFHYFKDRYAFLLLGYATREPTTVARLKSGPFGQLLGKPVPDGYTTRKPSSSAMRFQPLNDMCCAGQVAPRGDIARSKRTPASKISASLRGVVSRTV